MSPRRPATAVAALIAGACLGLLRPAPATAADPSGSGAFASAPVAAVEELEEQRGRFVLPNGAMLDLVLSSTQIVNGQTVSSIEVNAAGLAAINALRPAAERIAAARGLATDIRNSMDNAVIGNRNNLTVTYTRPPAVRTTPVSRIASFQTVLSAVGGR